MRQRIQCHDHPLFTIGEDIGARVHQPGIAVIEKPQRMTDLMAIEVAA
jgi:hypothetical protein